VSALLVGAVVGAVVVVVAEMILYFAEKR